MTEMERSECDKLRMWTNSVAQKSKKRIIPVCLLCLSPLALCVLSSYAGCRKHSCKCVKVMLNCFKMKFWETKWLYVLVMKTQAFLLLMYFSWSLFS